MLSAAVVSASHAATVTNLSTRGLVGTGNDVMILGVVVEGEPGTHIPVVFRGIGPLLGEFGVTNAVENPSITLFAGSDGIAANDDWMLGGQMNALAASGLAPTYESEAAMVANLAPGVYTLHLSGGTGMGNALGEAYFIEKKTIVENLVAAGNFNTLVAAVQAADLVDVLNSAGEFSPFTLFAPTDEAFAALPAGTVESLLGNIPALTNILLYHVVPRAQVLSTDIAPGPVMTANGEPVSLSLEGGVFVNTSQVIEADWLASNGVIHPVSSVILPGPESTTQTIVQNLVAQGNFSTLVAAVTAAGLVDTLNGAGPFTLFAPTDAAFAKLPAGTVEALLADIPTLTDILLYHVVSGAKVLSGDVVPGAVTMANGDPATLSATGGLKINQANITGVDWESSNGVIHFIDEVILPPAP
ncbi:hypothetical protein ASA1KI_14130 [Opitutales bacterium ASA1]|nr:hypothetical protein ASA1KI_14130 [Opitutales bacterium ASA1]